ncbi:pancreatic lipase-related protein 2-like isoform X2 [Anthonomus grandis grandis]|nr:pancreatic lipase-related protein 2-like isoform X2 [Anthonomus grandis grandis]
MLKDAYLKMYQCNVVLMDWKMGARGPYYASAAANTELVGRELGMLLVNMVENGLYSTNIHLIGFSLGAHVAGTASEPLKQKGHMIGRITGLDAASPLFRREYFKEKYKKLDRGDATFVDVLHTDSSPFITDGFGLWEPIGHVDFFPNGGQEQPGCSDPRSSIVVTHLEGRGLSRDSVCSHVRAFHLFLESLTNKMAKKENGDSNSCQFMAYSCPGGMPSFEKGHCFPLVQNNSTDLYKVHEIGQFGEDVKGKGVMYFSTKDSSPYCGTQLQASVYISQKTAAAEGVLQLVVSYMNKSVIFHIDTDGKDLIMTGSRMSGLSVADFNSLDPKSTKSVTTYLYFFNTDEDMGSNRTLLNSSLYVDKILVRDMYGNSWQYCEKDMLIGEKNPKQVLLSTGNYC